MNPVPSPRRTLPGAWSRVAPRMSGAPDWMAVMWTTAGLTRATTSAKEGGPPGAGVLAPPATGRAPTPPTRTPSSPAMAATSANESTRTGRGMLFLVNDYTGGTPAPIFAAPARHRSARSDVALGQEAHQAFLVEHGHAQLFRLVALRPGVLARHD